MLSFTAPPLPLPSVRTLILLLCGDFKDGNLENKVSKPTYKYNYLLKLLHCSRPASECLLLILHAFCVHENSTLQRSANLRTTNYWSSGWFTRLISEMENLTNQILFKSLLINRAVYDTLSISKWFMKTPILNCQSGVYPKLGCAAFFFNKQQVYQTKRHYCNGFQHAIKKPPGPPPPPLSPPPSLMIPPYPPSPAWRPPHSPAPPPPPPDPCEHIKKIQKLEVFIQLNNTVGLKIFKAVMCYT